MYSQYKKNIMDLKLVAGNPATKIIVFPSVKIQDIQG